MIYNPPITTGGGHTIEDEGTPLTQRTNLNFVGAGVTVTDDAGNDATVVTIPSYTLPTASASVLGGIKVGTRLSIDGNGVLSADVQAGGGDTIAPASNTADYIPQWNGANSKTLKDGLAVPAGGLAGLTALGGKLDTGLAVLLDQTTPQTLSGGAFAGSGLLKITSGTLGVDTATYLTTVTAHNLLSTTHGDTTADTVVRGDIITGQGATPKWTRLAFPATPTGKVLIATATDVAWSASALGSAAYTASTAYAAALSGTANTIAYWDSTTTIASLALVTYPSLTEFSYVKGVTSGIQSQLNAKGTGNGDMLLGTAQSVTETKTFTKDKLLVKGTSTGTTNITTANTSATNYTATLPAKDGTIAMTSDIVSQVEDNITDGHTTIAPSGNAVFDALALKAPIANSTLTGTFAIASDINIGGKREHLRYTLLAPATAYGVSATIPVWVKTDAAITITNLEVSCDADPTTELTGDIKWADAVIGLGNATVINDFDTTNGVRSDSSISAGSVASGKCIYISFDTTPDAALKSISFDLTYHY